MKKVMILGANGMAGHMISMYFKTLNNSYKVIDVCHSKKLDESSIVLNIKDIYLVTKLIDKINPDIIINCIGILNKGADINKSDTIFINSYFPRYLEHYLKNTKIKIIHLSTDCVFSGSKGGYSEESCTDGKDLYAKTKILGEINNDKDLTIRTSIIGPELKKNGTGLFHWFMNQKGKIRGYSNVIWSGVTTLELASCIDKMIKNNITGLYNLAAKKPINKYDLLNMISKIFNKKLVIEKYEDVISDKSLVTNRLDFAYDVPDYEKMLYEMKYWMLDNSSVYSKIYNVGNMRSN